MNSIVEELAPNSKQLFTTVCLSRRTVCRRISEMSINLHTQLKEIVEYFTHFSLALDECCDNTGTA